MIQINRLTQVICCGARSTYNGCMTWDPVHLHGAREQFIAGADFVSRQSSARQSLSPDAVQAELHRRSELHRSVLDHGGLMACVTAEARHRAQVAAALQAYGIEAMCCENTALAYFYWVVPHACFPSLSALVPAPPPTSHPAASAFCGLALVLEFLDHGLRAAEPPIALDLSLYAQPVHNATVPVPYSLLADGVLLPVQSPRCEANLAALQRAYAASALAKYHRHYMSESPHPPAAWPASYDRISPADLPACLSLFLHGGGERLRTRAGLQHFTRGMLSLGWHPRHIAGLVWCQLTRAGEDVEKAAAWSAHAVRQCAARVFAKLDRLEGLDCDVVRSQGFCPPNPVCPVSLPELRVHLAEGVWQP